MNEKQMQELKKLRESCMTTMEEYHRLTRKLTVILVRLHDLAEEIED